MTRLVKAGARRALRGAGQRRARRGVEERVGARRGAGLGTALACRSALAAVLLVAGVGAAATPGRAWPTNIELVGEAVTQAVERALGEMGIAPAPTGGLLLLQAGTRHQGNWLVEHALADRLLERGFRVTLDSLVTGAGDDRLTYRILGLRVVGRSSLLTSSVQRSAEATVALAVSRGGALVWQQEFSGVVHDRIPKDQVEIAGGSEPGIAKMNLTAQSWSQFVEPVVASATLGGLVYLFFSNR